jgi:hypothetical protein
VGEAAACTGLAGAWAARCRAERRSASLGAVDLERLGRKPPLPLHRRFSPGCGALCLRPLVPFGLPPIGVALCWLGRVVRGARRPV